MLHIIYLKDSFQEHAKEFGCITVYGRISFKYILMFLCFIKHEEIYMHFPNAQMYVFWKIVQRVLIIGL